MDFEESLFGGFTIGAVKQEPAVEEEDDDFETTFLSRFLPAPPIPKSVSVWATPPGPRVEMGPPLKRDPLAAKKKEARGKTIILDDLTMPNAPAATRKVLPAVAPVQKQAVHKTKPALDSVAAAAAARPLETPQAPTEVAAPKYTGLQALPESTHAPYVLTTEMNMFEKGEAEEQQLWDSMHATCDMLLNTIAVLHRLTDQLTGESGSSLVLAHVGKGLQDHLATLLAMISALRSKNILRTGNVAKIVSHAIAVASGAAGKMDFSTAAHGGAEYMLTFDNGTLQPYTMAEEICLSEFDLVSSANATVNAANNNNINKT